MKKSRIKQAIEQSIQAKKDILSDDILLDSVRTAVDICVQALGEGGKVLFCGNGGSAADAQHLAAELSGRFYFDRDPLFAEALHVNTSFLTAVSNDYSFEEAYARIVRAFGKKEDVLFALSTSGNSPNIIRAAEDAQKIGIQVIAMTGRGGGRLKEHCDILINVPSADTPRIQECHMLIGHLICEFIEDRMFEKPN